MTPEAKLRYIETKRRAVSERVGELTPEQKLHLYEAKRIAESERVGELTPDKKLHFYEAKRRAESDRVAGLTPEEKLHFYEAKRRAESERVGELTPEKKLLIKDEKKRAESNQRAKMTPEEKNYYRMSKSVAIHERRQQQFSDGIPDLIRSCLSDDLKIEYLSEYVLSTASFNEGELDFLRNNYTKHPNFSLAYYHCCSVNPGLVITTDDFQSEPNKNKMWNRLSQVIGHEIGQK